MSVTAVANSFNLIEEGQASRKKFDYQVNALLIQRRLPRTAESYAEVRTAVEMSFSEWFEKFEIDLIEAAQKGDADEMKAVIGDILAKASEMDSYLALHPNANLAKAKQIYTLIAKDLDEKFDQGGAIRSALTTRSGYVKYELRNAGRGIASLGAAAGLFYLITKVNGFVTNKFLWGVGALFGNGIAQALLLTMIADGAYSSMAAAIRAVKEDNVQQATFFGAFGVMATAALAHEIL